MGCTPLIFLVLSVAVPQPVSSASLCDGAIGDPPTFTSDGQPPHVVLVDLDEDGDNLVLPCGVTGTFPITVSWFRSDSMISQIPIMDSAAIGTLSIRVTEAEAPREGTNYYCVATNRVGPGNSTVASLRSQNVNVSHLFFDGFKERVAEIATIEGGSVALECAFNASNPAPNITWFANETIIAATSRIRFLEGGHYLYIESLSAADRDTRYYCAVHNFRDESDMPRRAPTTYTLNTDIANGTLMVYKNQGFGFGRVGDTVPVVFAAAAVDSSNTLADIILNCAASSGNEFLMIPSTTVGTTASVTITDAPESEDEVNFSCVLFALSIPAAPVMGTIIVSRPESSPIITNALPGNGRERLVDGGPMEYSCEASGSPSPIITWYYNGVMVQSSSGGVVVGDDGSSLTIPAPQVNNSGIYQCFARNQFGQDSRAWILEVGNPGVSVIANIAGAEEIVDADNDLELHCMFFEVLPTTVLWSKDRANLSNSDQFDISPVMNGMSTLRISSMAVKDGDVYTCTTTSDCGSDSMNVTIGVQESGGDSDDSSDDGGAKSVGHLVGGIVTAVVSVLVVIAVQLF